MTVGGSFMDKDNNDRGWDGPHWAKDDDNFIDVQNDKPLNFPEDDSNVQPFIFKPYRPNMENDYIECYGELFDDNGIFGFSRLGDHSTTIPLKDLELTAEVGESTVKTIVIDDFDDQVEVTFTVTRIK